MAFREGNDYRERVAELYRGRASTSPQTPADAGWKKRRDERTNWRVRQHAPDRRTQDNSLSTLQSTATRKRPVRKTQDKMNAEAASGGMYKNASATQRAHLQDWGWRRPGIFPPEAHPARRPGGGVPGGGPGLPTGVAGDFG